MPVSGAGAGAPLMRTALHNDVARAGTGCCESVGSSCRPLIGRRSCDNSRLYRQSEERMSILTRTTFRPDESTPLYQQLYEHSRGAILSGQLKQGAKLPSTRGL